MSRRGREPRAQRAGAAGQAFVWGRGGAPESPEAACAAPRDRGCGCAGTKPSHSLRVKRQTERASGAEGRRGASARHSFPSSLALGSSRLQPLAAWLCSCAESAAVAAFYRLPESLGRCGPGGPARRPMAARPPRPALGGARLTAPPPPASADWRPEQPWSPRGLAEGWIRVGTTRPVQTPLTLQIRPPPYGSLPSVHPSSWPKQLFHSLARSPP